MHVLEFDEKNEHFLLYGKDDEEKCDKYYIEMIKIKDNDRVHVLIMKPKLNVF